MIGGNSPVRDAGEGQPSQAMRERHIPPVILPVCFSTGRIQYRPCRQGQIYGESRTLVRVSLLGQTGRECGIITNAHRASATGNGHGGAVAFALLYI